MIALLSYLLILFNGINASHFNGGTITWAPVDPFDNSSSVTITIKQSYSWSYPKVSCATNVPISTGTYSTANTNLTCLSGCSTDGGYSQTPVNILTDCTSFSTSLGVMSSERSVNITLNSSAYFYLAYQGSAWRNLNSPPQSGLSWSILSLINLVKRDDGTINTPPVASVISPQYAIVNTTTEIKIPVSDVNGDDVRCRWSVYRSGYRRRREIDNDDEDINHLRKKRQGCSTCNSGVCAANCSCSCSGCQSTTCNGSRCLTSPSCPLTTTTTAMTTTTTTSFLHPPIDECGSICSTNGLPNDTTLTNCTISFTGLVAGAWYAVSLQIEDFINDTSTDPMSSVPVQFLIYVLPTPTCTTPPLILPLTDCLEVQVGQPVDFILYAMNLCGTTVTITDILVVQAIAGITSGNVVNSTTNSSLVYTTLTWTPQSNQVGSQQLCTTAFNNLFVQSTQYCVTFMVSNSTPNCSTTTTTLITSTTRTSSKSTASINVPLIVGLSLLGLFLSLCMCGCLLYHLLWSDAARRRRQERKLRGAFRQKEIPSFSPFAVARNLPFQRPSKAYLVHNITDRRASTYTCRSSIPNIELSLTKPRRLSPLNISNNKDISVDKNSIFGRTSVKENTSLDSSRGHGTNETTLSPVSARRVNNMSRISRKIGHQNIDTGLNHSKMEENDLTSSPKVRVMKIPRKRQSKIQDISRADDHLNDSTIVPMKRDDMFETRRSAIKEQQRSDSMNRSTDNEERAQGRSTRVGTVTVSKVRRSSKGVKPMND